MERKLIRLIVRLIDIISVLAYTFEAMIMLGPLLSGKEWINVNLGNVFADSQLFFAVWVFSLFYIPIRLLLGEKFWKIIFNDKTKEEIEEERTRAEEVFEAHRSYK